MLITGLALLFSLVLPLMGDVEPMATRSNDRVRIERALDIHDIIGGAALSSQQVDEKLSSMSDQELKQFANSVETTPHATNPMVVVIASIAMLILVVGLIVRWVD